MNKNKVEFIKDTFDEYLSKDSVSASDLKNFLKSPRSYFYEKNRTEPRPEKRHFSVGSALHQYIMEIENFDDNFIVSPKFDRRKKQGKLDYEEFVLKAEGKTIINDEEMDMIKQMSVNAKMNKTFMEFLEGSQYEVSCYTKDDNTGLDLRLRPDILPTNKNTIVDIKSCLDSSPNKFKKDVNSYGYALSAAYYMDFIGRENYVFAAIEKSPPYQASMYVLSDEIIALGRYQYRMALDLLKWSRENNYWCDYIEFEILKEKYLLGELSDVIDTIEKSELINILK
tara:strand:+ start:3833 stop:4681 length:849 start_codon:yes stop_codon:yes gene_type:complete